VEQTEQIQAVPVKEKPDVKSKMQSMVVPIVGITAFLVFIASLIVYLLKQQ
jgi:hypothetical protein